MTDVGTGSSACAPANTSISTTLPPFRITPAVLTEYGSELPAVPGSGRDSKVTKLLTPCPSLYVVVTPGPLTISTPAADCLPAKNER